MNGGEVGGQPFPPASGEVDAGLVNFTGFGILEVSMLTAIIELTNSYQSMGIEQCKSLAPPHGEEYLVFAWKGDGDSRPLAVENVLMVIYLEIPRGVSPGSDAVPHLLGFDDHRRFALQS